MNRLQEVLAEQKVIQARLDEIAAMPEPEGDEAARSKAFEDRDTETDDLLARWDELDKERKPLAERAGRLEAVRAKALELGNRESGDGARPWGDRGPEFKKSAEDPFDTDPRKLDKTEVISRAMTVIDREKRVPITDANKAHLEKLIHRSEADDDSQFDGTYVARRALFTENPLYRSAFRKYMRLGSMAAYNHDEQRAVAAFQDYEIQRAASENTTTAGGFGVPVKLAA